MPLPVRGSATDPKKYSRVSELNLKKKRLLDCAHGAENPSSASEREDSGQITSSIIVPPDSDVQRGALSEVSSLP